MHANDLPPKPKRLRPGVTQVTRIGFVGIEEPKVEEGEGRWLMGDATETQRFRFDNSLLFPEVKWEDEPIKGHVCFIIEKD